MVSDSSDKQLNNKGNKRGLHPNSLKNLEKGRKPWKRKQSGNPEGRPPNELCITSRQKAMLSEICPFDAQHRTWLDALAEAGMRMALVKPEAMRDFMARHYGQVSQLGDEENPLYVQLLTQLRDQGDNKHAD